MPRLSDLIDACDALLEPGRFADYAPNGLQVPGPEDVSVVVTGVSASAELFARAAKEDADLILVHHGLFWKGAPLGLDRVAAARLRTLFTHGMALAAYHLPLDGHMELGNNALLARAVGLEDVRPFASHGGTTIGAAGTFPGPGVARDEFVSRVRAACHDREPLVFPAGPDPVRSAGFVSGAAADHVHDALAEGLDAFVTGEPNERVMSTARENGITFLAAGHYATETHGVRALGDHLAESFGVHHVFVDVWNPI